MNLPQANAYLPALCPDPELRRELARRVVETVEMQDGAFVNAEPLLERRSGAAPPDGPRQLVVRSRGWAVLLLSRTDAARFLITGAHRIEGLPRHTLSPILVMGVSMVQTLYQDFPTVYDAYRARHQAAVKGVTALPTDASPTNPSPDAALLTALRAEADAAARAPAAATDRDGQRTDGALETGRVYSWDELADQFGFKADYLGAAGGMISRPDHGALLLITHPGGAKSFDYEDYWDGDDLVYTGRGKTGDQQLSGQNRDVADNARRLLVFQPAGTRQLEYLGEPTCVEHWWAQGRDSANALRRIVRFRLRFGSEVEQLDAYRASEGARRRVVHERIERDRGLVAAAKRAWRKRDPALRCEACGFSFAERYGDVGVDYIEAHHRKPLASLDGATETSVADLAAVCANCHRILHRDAELTVERLRATLSEPTRATD